MSTCSAVRPCLFIRLNRLPNFVVDHPVFLFYDNGRRLYFTFTEQKHKYKLFCKIAEVRRFCTRDIKLATYVQLQSRAKTDPLTPCNWPLHYSAVSMCCSDDLLLISPYAANNSKHYTTAPLITRSRYRYCSNDIFYRVTTDSTYVAVDAMTIETSTCCN